MSDNMLPQRITRAIRRFESAAIAKSWIGKCEASEHDQIKEEYTAAKKALWKAIEELQNETQLSTEQSGVH